MATDPATGLRIDRRWRERRSDIGLGSTILYNVPGKAENGGTLQSCGPRTPKSIPGGRLRVGRSRCEGHLERRIRTCGWRPVDVQQGYAGGGAEFRRLKGLVDGPVFFVPKTAVD